MGRNYFKKKIEYSLRCEFDYMKPNFNLRIDGFPRDPDSGKDKNFNYIKKNLKMYQLREYALSHYSNRKKYFSNDLILDYSRNYKE